jgi:RNA polymerase sigma factor (sigma-70 family)
VDDAHAIAHISRRPAALRLLRDERLARHAAAGSRDAFAVIFERHHQGLYRYCRSMLDHDDASDALQMTMTAALRSLPGERREVALKPWLYRIAHNEAISLLRRRRPTVELPEDVGSAAGPEQQVEMRQRFAELAGDLRELPERQSGALVMRELNDLSYDEIAATFDISEAAAKQSVYHARLALRQFSEGREMECEAARKALSDGDGRVLRGLKLRAHLRHCEDCTTFKAAFLQRRASLSMLAPPIAPGAAAALLEGVMHGGGGAGGGGLLALLSGAGSKLAASGAVLKTASAVGVAVVVGAAGVATVGEVRGTSRGADENGSGATAALADATPGQASPAGQAARADDPGRVGSGGKPAAGAPTVQLRAGAPNDDDSTTDDGADGGSDPGLGDPIRRPSPSSPVSQVPANGPFDHASPTAPPGAGGPASEPGREQAREQVPSDLPSPAQQMLGGEGQGATPNAEAPAGVPEPPLRPAPPQVPSGLRN